MQACHHYPPASPWRRQTTRLNTKPSSRGRRSRHFWASPSASRRILVETPGFVVYYLDPHLDVLDYRFSGEFEPLHDMAFHQGILDHKLDGAEKASMGKVVTFPWAPDGNSPQLKRFWKY